MNHLESLFRCAHLALHNGSSKTIFKQGICHDLIGTSMRSSWVWQGGGWIRAVLNFGCPLELH